MIDVEQIKNSIRVSYINKDHLVEQVDIEIQPKDMFNWLYLSDYERKYGKQGIPNKKFKSWDKKDVIKVKSNHLSKFRIEEILMSQDDYLKSLIYEYNMPDMYFMDIEVYSDDYEFPEPNDAKYPISMVSIVNNNSIYVLGTKDIKYGDEKNINSLINDYVDALGYKFSFKYIKFSDEYDLLYNLFNKYIINMPLITGWNFVSFDWVYLINRCKRLNIDISQSVNLHNRQDYMPYHKIVIDLLYLYKKYDTSTFKDNNTLDYVAKQVIGLNKIKYNGNLNDLYNNDLLKYIYYNAIDSVLVKLVNDKLQLVELYINIAKISNIPINYNLSTILPTEIMLCHELIKKNLVFPYVDKKELSDQAYKGAYVSDPTPGLYKWVLCCDFASLYPTIMRMWNISPDSFIGNADNIPQDILNSNGVIKAANNMIYDNTNDSALRIILTNLFNKRKNIKEDIYKLKLQLKNETDADNIKRIKDNINNLNNEQMAIKIRINSIYGCFGNKYFACYSIDMSESVTMQGQDIIKFANNVINNYFKNLWHKDYDLHNQLGINHPSKVNKDVTIYNDTDSVYFTLNDIINDVASKSSGIFNDEKIIKFINDIYNIRLKKYLSDCFDLYAKKWNVNNLLSLEFEKINYSSIFVAKKKYILEIAYKNPIIYKRLENISVTGIEIIRSSTPPFCRKYLMNIIKYILSNNINIDMIIKEIKDIKKLFMSANIEDISFGANISDYNKGVLIDSGSFVISKGCPIHVRAAGYYNYLLNKNYKYKNKYTIIKTKDKVKYYYTKDNFCNVFGFLPNNYPYEFAPSVDHDTQFRISFLIPINRILNAIGHESIADNFIYFKKLF